MKRHNVCRRHVAIGTGFKQTEGTIFPCYFNGIRIATAVKCIFEGTMPKLAVNFGNHISQLDSHKNQYPGPVCNFCLLHHNTVTNGDQICRCSNLSLSLITHTHKLLDQLHDHPIHALVSLFGTSYHVLALKHSNMTSSLYQRMNDVNVHVMQMGMSGGIFQYIHDPGYLTVTKQASVVTRQAFQICNFVMGWSPVLCISLLPCQFYFKTLK